MAKKIEKPKPTATAVMSFPQSPLRKAEEYLKAYTTYAFTAISAIAQEVGSVQLKLFDTKYTKDGPEAKQIHEHEVLSLLQYFNPLTTFYDAVEATQIYLELTGEAFWVVLKEGNVPKEIWIVRPDWVKIMPDTKEIIKHYNYHPGGIYNEKVEIPKENVIHFKYFNPLNPYRGKGSIQAAALPLDIHTFAQEWNRNFFYNSAIPGLVFTTEKKLNKKVIQRFMNQWQSSYGGRAKSNKIAFLGNGMKMDTTTMKIKDMDFSEQQAMMRDDILSVFKVPKTILGLTKDINRANAEATTRAFMERVVTPRMVKFAGALTEFLLPMYGDRTKSSFFDFVDPSPEDVELKLKKYENARKYTWMTPNEIRIEENLEPIDDERADDLFAQMGSTFVGGGLMATPNEEGEEDEGKGIFKILKGKKKEKIKPKRAVYKKEGAYKKKGFKHMMPIPVKKLEDIDREKLEKSLTKDLTKLIGRMLKIKNGENQKVGVSKKEGVSKKKKELFDEEGKDAYWRQFIEHVTEREEELKEKTIELFKEQEKMVLENLETNVRYWKKDYRKGKESSVLPSLEEMVLMWKAIFLVFIREIVIEQGAYVLDFLGVGGDLQMTTDTAVEYLREHGADLVVSINETTRNKLKKTLAEGFDGGESVPQLSNRVRDVFREATRTRSKMIAITEAVRASNFGTLEAYRQSGVVRAQEWLAERDGRACEFCLEMDGKVIGLDKKWFKKGEELTVDGNTLKFDLIDINHPPIHPRGRCTLIPVLIGSE